jgi:hypothetical protein
VARDWDTSVSPASRSSFASFSSAHRSSSSSSSSIIIMFIINWFWDVLAQFGAFTGAAARAMANRLGLTGLLHKNAKILFLGLDNAGKTVRAGIAAALHRC